MRRLALALGAIALLAIAGATMPAAAVVDQRPDRLAQKKTTVVQVADDIALRPMPASVNRDPMVPRQDLAATLREALPESPRLELLALVYGMLLVTVGGLLAIYFADRKNARRNP
jgi:hypothetical protein